MPFEAATTRSSFLAVEGALPGAAPTLPEPPEPPGRVEPRLERQLARQIRGAVYHALTYYGERRWPELIDDLTQEVWCRLLEHRALARCRAAQVAARRRYLRRVAVNVVVDAMRARGARKRQPAALLSLDAASVELARCVQPASCPERRLLAREELRALVRICREAVGEGPRERWRVARLGLLEGRSSSDIARGLGGRWSVMAIDSYLARVRQRLDRLGVRVAQRPRGRSAGAGAGRLP